MTSATRRTSVPRYGDIFDVEFDPAVGAETARRRPALVVSNDVNNLYAQTVTVVPITSQPAPKVYVFNVFLPKGSGGLTADSRIKADQIRTVDKRRLLRFRGQLTTEHLDAVRRALKIHLNMVD